MDGWNLGIGEPGDNLKVVAIPIFKLESVFGMKIIIFSRIKKVWWLCIAYDVVSKFSSRRNCCMAEDQRQYLDSSSVMKIG